MKTYILLLLICINNLLFSQTFTVTKFELDNDDNDGSNNWVKDLNGNKCALIKIDFKEINIDHLVLESEGNTFVKVIKIPPTGIWIYVPAETKRIIIATEKNGNKKYVDFPSGNLYATKTYKMELELNNNLEVLDYELNKINIQIQEELIDNEYNFIKLIGSNKRLLLNVEKIFDIAGLSNIYNNKNIEFREVHDGKELIIKNVENLEIIGNNLNYLNEIITLPEYGFVLVFENCKKILIKNMKLGHGPTSGHCTGGVLKFVNCEDIKIENAILYGSGTTGIDASNTKKLYCNKININTCTYNIMNIESCLVVFFSNSTFSKNKQFDLINIGSTKNCTFDNCIFEDNFSEENLFNFSYNQNNSIDIFNSIIRNNTIKNLSNKLELLNLKNTTIQNR